MDNIKAYSEHWKKIDSIAGGGQGTTIKASRIDNPDLLSAVKILNKQNDIERRARMHRESTALSTINHPSIPKVLGTNSGFWEDTSYKLFIATEFIAGKTLSEVNLSGFSLKEKAELAVRIAQVIDYCHQLGIIHRDIKPDNIILRNEMFSDPVIIDFGISFNFHDNDNDNLTPDGQQLGNRFLSLPEQKVGEAGKRDYRTDVTFLVGILYYIIVNEMPVSLIDENGQKPHQRPIAKEVLAGLPTQAKAIINNIFDIGFNQIIDSRWQTSKSLIEQITLLDKNEDFQDSPESYLHIISAASISPIYQEQKLISDTIRDAQIEVQNSRRKAIEDLQDWTSGTTVMGFNKYRKEGYSIQQNLSNRGLVITINTYTKVFITGSELVIDSIVEGIDFKSTRELFRQPVRIPRDWRILHAATRAQCLEAIAKSIQNKSSS